MKPGEIFERRETHAAVIYLVGDRAYKIKKALKLPYLDFSTRDKRLAVLSREMEVNRTWSPDLYIGVTERDGEPVLEMKRFDERHMLSELVQRKELTDQMCENLASTVANSHRLAPVASADGVENVEKLLRQIERAFKDSPDIFGQGAATEFSAHAQENLARHRELLSRRARGGFVRRCHGDLHCRNIFVENGKPILFDAIEFSEELATIDVLYDLAFLLMDLLRLGQSRAANLVMNHYFDLMRDREDLSGIALLPLFLAVRAGVRALVAADLAHELEPAERLHKVTEAQGYLKDSLAYLEPRKPFLVAVGGFSGTGKSTLARSLAPMLGPPPGAVVIRSDVERKRAAGIPLSTNLPHSAYSSSASQKVYEAIRSRAITVLTAGHTAITDAVFSTQEERERIQKAAKESNSGFLGLWLESPASVLRQRIETRTGDASDATCEVVDKQLTYDLGEMKWRVVDASASPSAVLEKAFLELKTCAPASSGLT